MAIKANIVSQKYYNQYRNGVDFSVNTSDYTRNLTGSVMEKIKVVTSYQLSWKIRYVASGGSVANFSWRLVFHGDELSVIRDDGGDFRDEGFAVGQSAYFGIFTSVYWETVCSILQISEDTIVLDMDGVTSLPFNPAGIRLMGDEPITALVYDFGLIENDENYNTVSKVTQNTQGYYGSSIGYDSGSGRSNSFVELNKLGKFNDFVTGSARCRFVERDKTETDIYQIFEVEHEFIINPWYLEGQLSDLQNGILPEHLDGSASLKYVSNAEFREVLNNPNIVYPILEDSVLGSVAFFDESFNGFNNDYQVESISYKESSTLATADGILVTGKTQVTVEISNKTGAPIPSGERYGVYVSYLPKESQYKDIIQGTLIDNFIYDNVLNNEGYAPKSGSDFIKSTTAVNNFNNLVITFEVEYSTIQKALLSQQLRNDNGNYIIGIQIGDNTLTSGNSDRVILKADVNTFDESPDIAGLSSITNFSIIPHNEEIGTSNYTSLKSWNEDGIIATFDYNLDLSKDAFLNELLFAIIAYNSTTNDYFILDSFQVDLSSSQVSNGVQLIDVDTIRNYNLISDSEFNQLKVQTGSKVGDIQSYNCVYAQKITWQDWIKNLNVNSVFIDKTKPNNNQNLKSSNYSNVNDYKIHLAVISNISGTSELGVSGQTNYLQLSPEIIVKDYDTSEEWSGEISTYRELNNEDLGGVILSGENTIMKTVWTNSGGAVASLSGIWAIHRIEPTDQEGFNIDELSSLAEYPSSNKLIPIESEALLKVEIDSGNVVTTCLIDGSKIDPSQSYNLSSRINKDETIENVKLTSPLGLIKETSGTVTNKTTSP